MRRRVSREQLLDASQSILSPRGNLRCKGGGMPNGPCSSNRRIQGERETGQNSGTRQRNR